MVEVCVPRGVKGSARWVFVPNHQHHRTPQRWIETPPFIIAQMFTLQTPQDTLDPEGASEGCFNGV
jgi:hypothetical protein